MEVGIRIQVQFFIKKTKFQSDSGYENHTEGHFRKGSKEQGPMKLSIPINQ
jgi:hypothetical protein